MSIPLATTHITVKGHRPQLEIDPDDDELTTPPEVLVNHVRACISLPAATRRVDNTDEVDEYALRCDIFDAGLSRYDTVIDESTGVEYEVRVSALSPASIFGMDHIKATLRLRKGLSSDQPNAS